MISVLGFALVLIPLVVVHELGHFIFAKLFNVRADAFSIGFGPVIFNRKIGETDFRVSAIPLGGYVKLLGEDPTSELSPEEKKRALHHQAPWKRFFIFFGGPFFNFIWAVLVFMLMMVLGEPQIGNVIGRVLPDSVEEKAGVLAGDKIVAVDGIATQKLEEIFQAVETKPNQMVSLSVERALPGTTEIQKLDIQLKTTAEEGFSSYGEEKIVGGFDGLFPNARLTRIGIADPNSPAGKAGLKTGDEITKIFDQPTATFEALVASYQALKNNADPQTKGDLRLEIKSGEEPARVVTLPYRYTGNLAIDTGIHSSELFVEQALPGTPAEKAGIQAGDRLVSVNGMVIRSFFELRKNIQKVGESGSEVKIDVERAGARIELAMKTQSTSERDPLLRKKIQHTIGVAPVQSMKDAQMLIERTFNPITLVVTGVSRMLDMSWRNLVSIGKMFVGQVSVKSLGGPILIGKLAGDSINRGLLDFLRMMAVLSIGLGILNILPIPVLDGGHIVLLGIEVLRGKSLSFKQIEMAQKVGMVLILSIMIIVLKNDVARLPIFN